MFIKIPCCQTAITRTMCCTVDNILQLPPGPSQNLQSRCTTGVGPTEPPTEPASITSRSLGSFISTKKNVMSVWGLSFFFNSHTCSCVSSNFRQFQPPAKKQRASLHIQRACSWNNTLGVPTDWPSYLIKRTAKTNCQEILRHPFFSPYKNGGN